MISRFLTLIVVLVIALGLMLHFQVDVPGYLIWIGHLPGDLILKKGEVVMYLPFATAIVFSLALLLLGSLVSSD